MKNKKIIELIKKYRAKSEIGWTPNKGWKNEYSHNMGIAYGNCADDLEELLKSMKGGENHENKN